MWAFSFPPASTIWNSSSMPIVSGCSPIGTSPAVAAGTSMLAKQTRHQVLRRTNTDTRGRWHRWDPIYPHLSSL
jgi:hypothetical protein